MIHQSIQGKVKSITAFRDRVGDYYASILSETSKKIPDKPTELEEFKVIGIDLGIGDFLTDSFNRTVDKSKELNSTLKKLKKAHKEVSRKEKEEEGEARRSGRLAKVYRKVARKCEDFQHKVSKRLIDESQAVIAESLKIKNMMHNRKLARSIADAD